MEQVSIDEINVTANKTGADKYQKVSYPMRFGEYSIIETPEYLYHLNLKGQVRFIQAKNDKYWSKDEWLKRTDGNDWIYYTPGIYTGLKSFIGEYYLPCFSFKSNSIFAYDPFVNANVKNSINWLACFPWSEKINLDNMCFSGSVKGFRTLPFLFPMNTTERHQDLIINGLRGVVSEKEYVEQIGNNQFKIPVQALGIRSNHFTYWTSPTLTRALVLLAFSKYVNLTDHSN